MLPGRITQSYVDEPNKVVQQVLNLSLKFSCFWYLLPATEIAKKDLVPVNPRLQTDYKSLKKGTTFIWFINI